MASIVDFPRQVKPGESLYTPEFKAFSRALPLAEHGAAMSILALMLLRGIEDLAALPSVQEMLAALHAGSDEARVLSSALRKLRETHESVFRGQLAHMRRWPSFMIEVLVP